MRRVLIGLMILGTVVAANAGAQEPDGTVKITRRSVSEAVGLSWGDGVLSFGGKEYAFTFQASGLLREIDPTITVAEISGQVFNLKKLEDFSGNYKIVKGAASVGGGGGFAEIKNQNGVTLNMTAMTAGHKFTLGADGMMIKLKE